MPYYRVLINDNAQRRIWAGIHSSFRTVRMIPDVEFSAWTYAKKRCKDLVRSGGWGTHPRNLCCRDRTSGDEDAIGGGSN